MSKVALLLLFLAAVVESRHKRLLRLFLTLLYYFSFFTMPSLRYILHLSPQNYTILQIQKFVENQKGGILRILVLKWSSRRNFLEIRKIQRPEQFSKKFLKGKTSINYTVSLEKKFNGSQKFQGAAASAVSIQGKK